MGRLVPWGWPGAVEAVQWGGIPPGPQEATGQWDQWVKHGRAQSSL